MHKLLLPFPAKGSAVYAILNKVNGKIYVGSSVRVNHRLTEHRCSLSDGKHGNRYLQRAFETSPDDFYVEVIEQCPTATVHQLLSKEQFWINFYKSYLPQNGYNISPTAESCRGVKHTPESIERMSKTRKGRKLTPEQRLRISIGQTGLKRKKRTEEQRRQMSLTALALHRKWTPEMRALLVPKMRLAAKKRPVLQFSLSGQFLRRFNSIKEAESELSGKRTSIAEACKPNGVYRHALGFVWRYASDAKESDVIPCRPRKPKGKHHGK